MLGHMRGKFANWVIGIVIGFIAFVFIFYGVYTPKTQQAMQGGAVGSINGDAVTALEFNRIMNRYAENLKQRGFQEEQLKMLGIQNWAWEEIVNQKLLASEASRQGVLPSEGEVRDQIQKIPAFQKDARFDLAQYKQVLSSNRLSAAQFEQSVRDGLLMEQWQEYFKRRAIVSDAEIKRDFALDNEKRNVAFVLLTNESGKKSINITQEEVSAFLKEPKNLEQAKSRFDAQKDLKFKGKKLEEAQNGIAREIILEGKTEAIRNANETLATKVMETFDGSAASLARTDSLVKSAGVKVERSGLFTRRSSFLAGIGEAKDLVKDAFTPASPLDPKQGGKAKKYNVARGIVVAILVDQQKPDFSQLSSVEMEKTRKKIAQGKEGELYGAWLKQLKTHAKITKNDAVFGKDAADLLKGQ